MSTLILIAVTQALEFTATIYGLGERMCGDPGKVVECSEGATTASGETFRPALYTAAVPLPTNRRMRPITICVRNPDTGHEVVLRVNDKSHPRWQGVRGLDLTPAAMGALLGRQARATDSIARLEPCEAGRRAAECSRQQLSASTGAGDTHMCAHNAEHDAESDDLPDGIEAALAKYVRKARALRAAKETQMSVGIMQGERGGEATAPQSAGETSPYAVQARGEKPRETSRLPRSAASETYVSPTGAKRDSVGKTPYAFLPLDLLDGAARVMAKGAAKYGNGNYRNGFPPLEALHSLMRHVQAVQAAIEAGDKDGTSGELLDGGETGTGEAHIHHVLTSALILCDSLRRAGYDV